MNNYQVEAKLNLVDQMINPIIDSLKEKGVGDANIYQVNLILEELFVNIANYAYPPTKGYVDISYDINENEMELNIEIKDKGVEFNPLLKAEPDISLNANERPIGGLGIYLVKKLCDEISYQRVNDENVLKLKKNIILKH